MNAAPNTAARKINITVDTEIAYIGSGIDESDCGHVLGIAGTQVDIAWIGAACRSTISLSDIYTNDSWHVGPGAIAKCRARWDADKAIHDADR